MKQVLTLFSAFLFMSFVFKTDNKEAYRLYDGNGEKKSYEDLLKAARNADVVMFGELHDNPICHWLQLELTKDIFETKKENLILGAEMFEADDQIPINEYLNGKISEKTLKEEVKLWSNFKTDYKPLLDFAKTNKLGFIATNIPRRYANMVYLYGLSSLDSIVPEAKKWIVPLPMEYDSELKCYKDIYKNAGGHGGENLPKSQAIKDATMASFILRNFTKGKTFLHFQGSYHSNYRQGIVWYLLHKNPDLKILVIGSTTQDKIDVLDQESKSMGDFVLCIPEGMTRTQ